MNDNIKFTGNDKSITPAEFMQLFAHRYPNESLEVEIVRELLLCSFNVSARRNEELVGYIRILTDGHMFGAIAHMMSLPALYDDTDFWKSFLRIAADSCPTRLILATNRMDARMMYELGWESGVPSFLFRNKPWIRPEKGTF